MLEERHFAAALVTQNLGGFRACVSTSFVVTEWNKPIDSPGGASDNSPALQRRGTWEI
jgi:hypothetical protein